MIGFRRGLIGWNSYRQCYAGRGLRRAELYKKAGKEYRKMVVILDSVLEIGKVPNAVWDQWWGLLDLLSHENDGLPRCDNIVIDTGSNFPGFGFGDYEGINDDAGMDAARNIIRAIREFVEKESIKKKFSPNYGWEWSYDPGTNIHTIMLVDQIYERKAEVEKEIKEVKAEKIKTEVEKEIELVKARAESERQITATRKQRLDDEAKARKERLADEAKASKERMDDIRELQSFGFSNEEILKLLA